MSAIRGEFVFIIDCVGDSLLAPYEYLCGAFGNFDLRSALYIPVSVIYRNENIAVIFSVGDTDSDKLFTGISVCRCRNVFLSGSAAASPTD